MQRPLNPNLLTERVVSGKQLADVGKVAKAGLTGRMGSVAPEVAASARKTVTNALGNTAKRVGLNAGSQAYNQARGEDGSFDLRRIDPSQWNQASIWRDLITGPIFSGVKPNWERTSPDLVKR